MAEIKGENTAVRHETSDVQLRPIALLGTFLVVLTAASLLITAAIFAFLYGRSEERVSSTSPFRESPLREAPVPVPPEPGDQLERLRTFESRALGSYAWIDREAGVVRIPIERAMELIVERAGDWAEPPRSPESER